MPITRAAPATVATEPGGPVLQLEGFLSRWQDRLVERFRSTCPMGRRMNTNTNTVVTCGPATGPSPAGAAAQGAHPPGSETALFPASFPRQEGNENEAFLVFFSRTKTTSLCQIPNLLLSRECNINTSLTQPRCSVILCCLERAEVIFAPGPAKW